MKKIMMAALSLSTVAFGSDGVVLRQETLPTLEQMLVASRVDISAKEFTVPGWTLTFATHKHGYGERENNHRTGKSALQFELDQSPNIIGVLSKNEFGQTLYGFNYRLNDVWFTEQWRVVR